MTDLKEKLDDMAAQLLDEVAPDRKAAKPASGDAEEGEAETVDLQMRLAVFEKVAKWYAVSNKLQSGDPDAGEEGSAFRNGPKTVGDTGSPRKLPIEPGRGSRGGSRSR